MILSKIRKWLREIAGHVGPGQLVGAWGRSFYGRIIDGRIIILKLSAAIETGYDLEVAAGQVLAAWENPRLKVA